MGSPADGSGDSRSVSFRETQDGFWRMELVTEVRADGVFVRFKPLHQSFRSIGFESIKHVHRKSYSAIDYGGWHWGVRIGPTGNTVYRITGEEGVELVTGDGARIFIGSQRPAELETAIQDTGGNSG